MAHAKPADSKLLRGNLCTAEQECTISAQGFRSQFLTLVHSCGLREEHQQNTKQIHWCDRCAALFQTSFKKNFRCTVAAKTPVLRYLEGRLLPQLLGASWDHPATLWGSASTPCLSCGGTHPYNVSPTT